VADAVRDYLAERARRNAETARDADWSFAKHLTGTPLADKPVVLLTERDLTDWRDGLTRGGRAARGKPAPLSPSTVKRLTNDLKAALRVAARRERASADVVEAIRDGLKAPPGADRAREAQILADPDVRRLVNAADAVDADFGHLLAVLAATGARFDQVARLTVTDFQPAARRLMVPTSRKGRGHKRSHVPVPIGDDLVARLRPLAAGRAGTMPLVTTWRHEQREGGPGRLRGWERAAARVAWVGRTAPITVPWRKALAAAGLPASTVPYALRHSSIVRQLRDGLPVRLVASAHDTSIGMIEKHYAAYIVDASDDLLRPSMLPLAPAPVTPLRAVNSK
jgi:integrase